MTTNEINEIKQTLNGTEVDSLEFEGCVGIKNGKVYLNGREVKKVTNKQWSILWDEAVDGEGGSHDLFFYAGY